MISDQQIRDDLLQRHDALKTVVGHDPDTDDTRIIISQCAEHFDIARSRVLDVYRAYIAAQMVGG